VKEDLLLLNKNVHESTHSRSFTEIVKDWILKDDLSNLLSLVGTPTESTFKEEFVKRTLEAQIPDFEIENHSKLKEENQMLLKGHVEDWFRKTNVSEKHPVVSTYLNLIYLNSIDPSVVSRSILKGARKKSNLHIKATPNAMAVDFLRNIKGEIYIHPQKFFLNTDLQVKLPCSRHVFSTEYSRFPDIKKLQPLRIFFPMLKYWFQPSIEILNEVVRLYCILFESYRSFCLYCFEDPEIHKFEIKTFFSYRRNTRVYEVQRKIAMYMWNLCLKGIMKDVDLTHINKVVMEYDKHVFRMKESLQKFRGDVYDLIPYSLAGYSNFRGINLKFFNGLGDQKIKEIVRTWNDYG